MPEMLHAKASGADAPRVIITYNEKSLKFTYLDIASPQRAAWQKDLEESVRRAFGEAACCTCLQVFGHCSLLAEWQGSQTLCTSC